MTTALPLDTELAQRLLARSVRDEATGCLRWTGAHTQKGYAHIAIDGRARQAHRVAYETWVGPIPEGLDIDHVATRGCRHRDCIEPTHLEAVTHAENVARQLAQITHCPKGHPYDAANTQWSTNHARGLRVRRCRVCKAEWMDRVVECECGRTHTNRRRSEHRRGGHHQAWVSAQRPAVAR